MATWVSVTSAGARAAKHFERDLQLALCMEPDPRIVPFQFDAAAAAAEPSQSGKGFATFLARQPELVGVIWYEMEALNLIEFAPAHLLQVFALAEISGWRSAQPLMARADVVGDLLARKSLGDRISVCAPQTRALSSIAEAMFPGKIVDAPIPFAAAIGFGADDEGLSLGIPSDISPEGWETLASFVVGLSQEATQNAPPVRIYASAEFFHSPYFELLRAVPGVSLIEGTSPDNRIYAGGDFLIGAAPDIHQLDMIARDAAVAGAALLILDGDTLQRGTTILDAAGALVPLAKLRTDPDFRGMLREAFNERTARVADQSKTFWQSLMLGGEISGPKGHCESIVGDAVYHALTDRGALTEETAASRAFLIEPGSAQHALNLAGALSRTDAAASWPLVALANRLARGTANRPLRPPTLDIGDGRLFVTDDHGPQSSSEQRRALQKWLDDLPGAPPEPVAKSGKRLPYSKETAGNGVISHSVGLSSNMESQHKIAAGGTLLFLKIADLCRTDEIVVVMEFSLVGEQSASRIDIEVIGCAPQKIALTSDAPRRVEIRARMPEDPLLGMVVKLLPIDLRWGHILLTNISVHSAEQQLHIGPDALAGVGFDLLETLPITTTVISGAFAVEQESHGANFRWISREVILKLPIETAVAKGDDAKAEPWLILRLRPGPYSDQALLGADIDLHGAVGKRAPTPLRRLGHFDGDVVLGAPIGPRETGRVVRVTLRSPNNPVSPADSRLAAACLIDMWIASPSPAGSRTFAPRFIPLDVKNAAQFAYGWYPIEHVNGLPSRWMSPRALLSSGFRPRADSKIFLALAGPGLPKDNPALVPFTVMYEGRPMSARSRIDSTDGWAVLFEGDALDGVFAADFELTADTTRMLGPNDPREASILASFATLMDPAGDAAPTTGAFGDAEAINCTLTVEHWGGGLSGAWLPPATIMACARSAETDQLIIEGAAATDNATIEGMTVEIDGECVQPEVTIGRDGSWTLRAAMGNASRGAALLLRLTAPSKGRVMLRRVGFE